MTKIERWNAAFAAMDDRARNELLMMAEAAAQFHPREQEKRLSLVPSDVGLVRRTNVLSHTEHVGPAPLIRAVK